MNVCVELIVAVFLMLHVEALPNVFEYEIEKIASAFENKDEQSNPGPEQGYVKLGKFSWKDCSTSAPMAIIGNLSVAPDPLTFPGPLIVQTDFILKKEIDAPLKAELKVYKKELGLYIEIPCIDNFGSCTYDDVCALLSQIRSQCPPPVKKAGIECSCPIKKRPYSLPKTEFDINASVIPSGDYHIKVNLTDKGAEAGCLDIYLSVA